MSLMNQTQGGKDLRRRIRPGHDRKNRPYAELLLYAIRAGRRQSAAFDSARDRHELDVSLFSSAPHPINRN